MSETTMRTCPKCGRLSAEAKGRVCPTCNYDWETGRRVHPVLMLCIALPAALLLAVLVVNALTHH